jgi:hypothetical protein
VGLGGDARASRPRLPALPASDVRPAYKLRARSRGRTPGAFVSLGAAVRALGGWARRGVEALLRRLERPFRRRRPSPSSSIGQRPDVVLITPLIDLGSSQIEYLRAARARRIPTALCVWSWDHLTSKALIRELPDRVFVWNDTQKKEAIALHRVPADRVVVTGAQCFDQWFNRTPSRSREDFCREVGLDPARPYLLWVCSALIYGSPVEATFVLEWIRRIRRSASPALRDVGILVRPHPSRTAEWESTDARDLNAVVWGSNPWTPRLAPITSTLLYHSAAVVGSTRARSSRQESSVARCMRSSCPSWRKTSTVPCTSPISSRQAAGS